MNILSADTIYPRISYNLILFIILTAMKKIWILFIFF